MEQDTTDLEKGSILIVDDAPLNLDFLATLMKAQGYTVYKAIQGVSALEFVESTLPDLILLDVMMPIMDGYEVCKRLKANERTRDIPVVFISAADQVWDKIKAFSTGGVDYITKPYQFEEVLSRVQTHMALASARKQLVVQNVQLQQMQAELERRVAERTAELAEANANLIEEIRERKRAEQALIEEHSLLRTLIDSLPDPVYVKDTKSRFLVANPATAQLMGSTPDELIGKTDFAFHPTELAAQYAFDERSIVETGHPLINKEELVIDGDGNRRWVLTSKVPFRDSQGAIKGTVGINQDITERKRMDQALREAHDNLEMRVEQRTSELKKVSDQLAAIYQVGQTITMHLQLDAVLDAITHCTADLLRTDTGVILLLNEDGETLSIRGAYGLSERVVQGTCDRVGESIAGRVVQSGQPIIANDLPNDPRFYNPSAEEEGLLACASVPLIIGAQIIGTLDVHSKTNVYAFNEEHIQILRMLASQAAIAIENGRLYQELQLAHDELEGRVLQRTAELVWANTQLRKEIEERERTAAALHKSEAAEHEQRVLAQALRETMAAIVSTLDLDAVMRLILENVTCVVPHEWGSIALFEDEGTARIAYWRNIPPDAIEFFKDYRFSTDQAVLGKIRRTGKPCFIADTQTAPEWIRLPVLTETRSYLGTPIQVHGKTIGVINLDSSIPGFFTSKDAELLQTFADQAAIAIENAQLYAELHRHAAELEQRVRRRTLELEQERAELQTILESMAEGVLHIDWQTRQARYVNQAFIDLVGPSHESISKQGVNYKGLLIAPDDFEPLVDAIRHTLTHGRIWQGSTKVRRQDGIPIDLGLIISPVPNLNGQIVGAVVLARDIGPEKALQAQKDRFIATASHELRTPITNLKLRLYLVNRQPEKSREHLTIIEDTVNYMTNLVESLLEVSRFERGIITLQRDTIVLQDIVAAIVNEFRLQAEQHNVALINELQTDPIHLYADPTRIRQVVGNLLANAINYTPRGGQVRIQLFTEQDEDGLYVILRVQDTGTGIAAEELPRLFEPFYRVTGSQVKGTGLGLTIAKEIVDLHGGRIAVESLIGQGSTFSVWLPVEQRQPENAGGVL